MATESQRPPTPRSLPRRAALLVLLLAVALLPPPPLARAAQAIAVAEAEEAAPAAALLQAATTATAAAAAAATAAAGASASSATPLHRRGGSGGGGGGLTLPPGAPRGLQGPPSDPNYVMPLCDPPGCPGQVMDAAGLVVLRPATKCTTANGQRNKCASRTCNYNPTSLQHECGTPTCSDGIQNAWETGKDCGGGCPSGCPQNGACFNGEDCKDLVCVFEDAYDTIVRPNSLPPAGYGGYLDASAPANQHGGLCVGSSCFDQVQNGKDETDVDCGALACCAGYGPGFPLPLRACPWLCSNGLRCNFGTDCKSNRCLLNPVAGSNKYCAAPLMSQSQTELTSRLQGGIIIYGARRAQFDPQPSLSAMAFMLGLPKPQISSDAIIDIQVAVEQGNLSYLAIRLVKGWQPGKVSATADDDGRLLRRLSDGTLVGDYAEYEDEEGEGEAEEEARARGSGGGGGGGGDGGGGGRPFGPLTAEALAQRLLRNRRFRGDLAEAEARRIVLERVPRGAPLPRVLFRSSTAAGSRGRRLAEREAADSADAPLASYARFELQFEFGQGTHGAGAGGALGFTHAPPATDFERGLVERYGREALEQYRASQLADLDGLTQPLAQPWGMRALALAPQARALLADALFPSPNPSYNLTKTDTVKAVRSRYMLNCEPYEVEMLTLRSNRVLNVTLLPGGWKSEIDLLQQLDWLEQDKAYCMGYSNWSLPDFNQTSADCSAYVYTLFNYTNCTDPVTGAFISNSTNCTGNLSQTFDVPPPNPARDALFPEAGSAPEVAATSYWTTPFPFGAGYRLLRRLAFGELVADVVVGGGAGGGGAGGGHFGGELDEWGAPVVRPASEEGRSLERFYVYGNASGAPVARRRLRQRVSGVSNAEEAMAGDDNVDALSPFDESAPWGTTLLAPTDTHWLALPHVRASISRHAHRGCAHDVASSRVRCPVLPAAVAERAAARRLGEARGSRMRAALAVADAAAEARAAARNTTWVGRALAFLRGVGGGSNATEATETAAKAAAAAAAAAAAHAAAEVELTVATTTANALRRRVMWAPDAAQLLLDAEARAARARVQARDADHNGGLRDNQGVGSPRLGGGVHLPREGDGGDGVSDGGGKNESERRRPRALQGALGQASGITFGGPFAGSGKGLDYARTPYSTGVYETLASVYPYSQLVPGVLPQVPRVTYPIMLRHFGTNFDGSPGAGVQPMEVPTVQEIQSSATGPPNVAFVPSMVRVVVDPRGTPRQPLYRTAPFPQQPCVVLSDRHGRMLGAGNLLKDVRVTAFLDPERYPPRSASNPTPIALGGTLTQTIPASGDGFAFFTDLAVSRPVENLVINFTAFFTTSLSVVISVPGATRPFTVYEPPPIIIIPIPRVPMPPAVVVALTLFGIFGTTGLFVAYARGCTWCRTPAPRSDIPPEDLEARRLRALGGKEPGDDALSFAANRDLEPADNDAEALTFEQEEARIKREADMAAAAELARRTALPPPPVYGEAQLPGFGPSFRQAFDFIERQLQGIDDTDTGAATEAQVAGYVERYQRTDEPDVLAAKRDAALKQQRDREARAELARKRLAITFNGREVLRLDQAGAVAQTVIDAIDVQGAARRRAMAAEQNFILSQSGGAGKFAAGLFVGARKPEYMMSFEEKQAAQSEVIAAADKWAANDVGKKKRAEEEADGPERAELEDDADARDNVGNTVTLDRRARKLWAAPEETGWAEAAASLAAGALGPNGEVLRPSSAEKEKAAKKARRERTLAAAAAAADAAKAADARSVIVTYGGSGGGSGSAPGALLVVREPQGGAASARSRAPAPVGAAVGSGSGSASPSVGSASAAASVASRKGGARSGARERAGTQAMALAPLSVPGQVASPVARSPSSSDEE